MKIVKEEVITEDGVDYLVKTFSNGTVVKHPNCPPPETVEPTELPEPEEPVDTDEVLAEILLNQANIKSKQEEQDEVLAMLLLNSRKGD